MAASWWAEQFAWASSRLPAPTTRLVAAHGQLVEIETTLPKLSTLAGGWIEPEGTIETELALLSTQAEGAQLEDVYGVSATVLQKLSTAATASAEFLGQIATALEKLTTDLVGSHTHAGQATTALPKLTTDSSATVLTPSPVTFGTALANAETNIGTMPQITTSADDDVLILWMSAQGSTFGTVTFNGQPMTKYQFSHSSGGVHVLAFVLENPPAVTNVRPVSSGFSGVAHYYAIGWATYRNVGSIGTPVSNDSGGTNTATPNVTASTSNSFGRFAFACQHGSTHSSFTGTYRGGKGTAAFVNQGLMYGDQAGGSSVVLTETLAAATAWVAVAIPLEPPPPS